MWTYQQSTGILSHNGAPVATGYSGKGSAKNKPQHQGLRAQGPIPRGKWEIGQPYNSARTGPYTITLNAVDEKPFDDTHQQTGRSAFRIHGDSIKNPGTASSGCIILPKKIREQIIRSGDTELEVIE